MKKSDILPGTRAVLSGIGVSSGYAIGRVHFLQGMIHDDAEHSITLEQVESEIIRFNDAVAKAMIETEALRERVSEQMGATEARIFDAHLLLLQDSFWVGEVTTGIRDELVDAVTSFRRRFLGIQKMLQKQNSRGGHQRLDDLRDVYERVMSHLTIGPEIVFDASDKPVVAAFSLSPSFVSGLGKDGVAALLSESGGVNAHASIIARSLRMPAVSGLTRLTDFLVDDMLVIVDGVMGLVITNPTSADVDEYQRKIALHEERQKQYLAKIEVKTQTTDGVLVRLLANLGLPAEAPSVMFNGGEGVGLMRSEFLFMDGIPDEDQQFEQYKSVLSRMAPKPVTIRTLDAGGDKFISGVNERGEENPFMGWRSIRVCLDEPVLFQTQLRALLRASVHGTLQIMFPFISSMEEWDAACEALRQAKDDLDAEGVPYDRGIRVGMMIEVPSAVLMAEEFARVVDFFSIGTNDLIQFLLAVDRTNDRVQNRYSSFHPALLRCIDRICKAARGAGRPVSICGELAAERLLLPVLIGLGVRDFSMSPWFIPERKEWVRELSYEECRKVAKRCVEYDSSEKVQGYLEQWHSGAVS